MSFTSGKTSATYPTTFRWNGSSNSAMKLQGQITPQFSGHSAPHANSTTQFTVEDDYSSNLAKIYASQAKHINSFESDTYVDRGTVTYASWKY